MEDDINMNRLIDDNEKDFKSVAIRRRRKLIKELCTKAWIILPIICVWLMLFWPLVRQGWLVLALFGIGGAVSWLYNVFNDDEIDMNSSESDSMPKFAAIWHWCLVAAFLVLTFWAMTECLLALFGSEDGFTWTKLFASLFSFFVVVTLAWLVVMISRGRNWKGFFIFYIIFDLMSAFSFNFIHFYNNISQTQYVDRVMKVAEYYSDIQKRTLEKMKSKANIAFEFVANKNSEIEEINREIQENNDSINRVKYTYTDGKGNVQNGSYLPMSVKKREEKLREKKKILEKDLEKGMDSLGIFDGLKDMIDATSLKKAKLDTLLLIPNPSMNEVVEVKNKIEEIQNGMEIYSAYRIFDSIGIDVSNDTILYINEVLNRKVEDRLGSVQKLFETLSYEFFMTNEERQEVDNLFFKPYLEHKQLHDFMKKEREYENRILILSIMLSMLIDIVPLALGVFVMLLRRKN